MKKSKNDSLVMLCVVAMLGAIAFALILLEFPIAPIPAAAHLKMDLSDIPALFAAIIYGPGAGVIVELVKNLLEFLTKGFGTQMGFGNLMNFIVGCAFVVPFSLVYHRFKSKGNEKKGMLFAAITGFISIVAVGFGANYLIAPLFFKYFLGTVIDGATLWAAIGSATIINAIKGIMLSFLSLPIINGIIKRIKFITK